MSYALLKSIHVTCVVLSGCGFVLRGYWMLRASPLAAHRLNRILPHAVDSLLLGSALGLAWTTHQYPFAQSWLTAKLAGLLLYIVLGSLALKRGRSRQVRATCFGLALLAYAYIVGAALMRSPWSWL